MRDGGGHEQAHFSLQVRPVQSAYMRAAGSVLARKPTRTGGLSNCWSPSAISASRLFATVPASTTLQDAGASVWIAMEVAIRV